MALSLFELNSVSSYTSAWESEIAYAFGIWFTCYFAGSYLYFRTLYLFTSTYIVTLALFHLGIIVPDAFGFFADSGLQVPAKQEWFRQAGWCTLLALGSFGLGFSWPLRTSPRERALSQLRPESRKNLKLLFQDGVGLLIASLACLGLAIASFGNLLNYSRVDFFRGVGDTRGLGVLLMVFPSAIIAMVVGAGTRSQRWYAAGIALVGCGLILLSGYRSAALFPMLVGAIVWTKTGRRIPHSLALGSIILVLIAISAAGSLRNVDSYKDIDSTAIAESVHHATVQDSLWTMGQTGALLGEVIRLVPRQDSYRLGQSYWLAVRSCLPNLLPTMRRSDRASGTQNSLTNVESIQNLRPADWLTYRVAPEKFDVGEGVGFTAIGEPYLNFGYVGVVIFFVLLGYGFARLDSLSLPQNRWALVFCSTMLWPLVTTVRQEIGNFLKPAFFTLLILVCWRGAGGFWSKRRRQIYGGDRIQSRSRNK